jgi:CTP synthase
VPYLAPSGELKTKPTQHSVAALRSIGITPDALILRCDREVPEALKDKIALMCDVDIDGVISTPDAPSIYDIPKVLHREELDAYVVRRLHLPFRDVDWTEWDDLLRRVHEPHDTVRIALVGKYIELSDAYLSVAEALRAGGFKHHAKVEIHWVASDDCETPAGATAALGDVHGVLIPGGFGIRGIEGKIGAIRHARARGLPVLGLCLGLQCIVIEAARSVGLTEANSAEFEPDTPDPVISTMADQQDIVAGQADLGGTMRLGPIPRSWSQARSWPKRTGRRRCPSGTGTATRSTTTTATGSPKAACGFPGLRPTATWWNSSNTQPRCTRSSWVPRHTPS